MSHSYHSVKTALLNGDICLHYQPIHELRTGALLGYEALARWGDLPPPKIAALVEEHSLELVWIRQQLSDIDRILAQTYPPIWISININQRTLAVPDLPALLNTSPHQLGIHIELLETVRLTPDAIVAIEKIGHRHILNADDIGSTDHGWIDRIVGSHARFFHGLKLCRGLTQNILTDERTATACELFIRFAGRFNMETIAEWVESEDQAAVLQSWGCTAGQGSLFGMPQPWPHWQ